MPNFFHYKMRFVTAILLVGYSFLHVKLTTLYVDTDLEHLINFTARLPFGQRVLVPALAHGLQQFLSLNLGELFFILELFFFILFYFVLYSLLKTFFDEKKAQVLTWLFLLLLPLTTVINYRLTMGEIATFSYPWDNSTLFFITLGYLFCLQERWFLFAPLIFLATFNRESTFLLVLLIPTLHWRQGAKILKPFFCALFAYVVARFLVMHFFVEVSGPVVEWYYGKGWYTNFAVNLTWLLDQNIIMLPFCFAGLPLFWFAFYDYIPNQYRPIRYLALFYFIGLLLIGSISEARIFSEIIIFMYLPVCLALERWLSGLPSYPQNVGSIIFDLDRYAPLIILSGIVIVRTYINQLIVWSTSGNP